MARASDDSSGVRKAALLLASLHGSTRRRLLAALDPDVAHAVAEARVDLDDVRPGEVPTLADEFFAEYRMLAVGGAGEEEDTDEASTDASDPDRLAGVLADEHPQTVAAVLAEMPSDEAADVLARLPSNARESVRRLLRRGGPEGTSPDVVDHVRRGVFSRLASESESLADETFTSAVAELEATDPRELALALVTASSRLRAHVLGQLSAEASARVSAALRELGPLRIDEVERAQNRLSDLLKTVLVAGRSAWTPDGRERIRGS
jgi:flagellar motor switch protein FliG